MLCDCQAALERSTASSQTSSAPTPPPRATACSSAGRTRTANPAPRTSQKESKRCISNISGVTTALIKERTETPGRRSQPTQWFNAPKPSGDIIRRGVFLDPAEPTTSGSSARTVPYSARTPAVRTRGFERAFVRVHRTKPLVICPSIHEIRAHPLKMFATQPLVRCGFPKIEVVGSAGSRNNSLQMETASDIWKV